MFSIHPVEILHYRTEYYSEFKLMKRTKYNICFQYIVLRFYIVEQNISQNLTEYDVAPLDDLCLITTTIMNKKSNTVTKTLLFFCTIRLRDV